MCFVSIDVSLEGVLLVHSRVIGGARSYFGTEKHRSTTRVFETKTHSVTRLITDTTERCELSSSQLFSCFSSLCFGIPVIYQRISTPTVIQKGISIMISS